VIMVTAWYPSIASPVSGVFVKRDAELIAAENDVEIVHLASPALISPDDREADRESGLPITRIAFDRSSPMGWRRVWAPLAARIQDADMLHTQAFTTLIPFGGRRVASPWVHSEHWSGVADPTSLTSRGRAVLRVTAPLLRRPDVVTTVSTYLSDQVRRHRSGPISVVPSVVPAAPTVMPPHDPALIRLVAVGGLVDGKDPLLALETARELERRGFPTSLTWVGDGLLRESVRRAARAADRLTLMGAVDGAGVSVALDAADIFILPTKGETLCLSALEAISHGRPVVIGARGGQRDYIDADNGVLVEPRTPAAYADAVLSLWRRRAALTPERVAATIGDRFQAPRVLAGYHAAYELARKSRRITG
jgi:L-malate glycosyltransferase